jgi:DNA adenine methylase
VLGDTNASLIAMYRTLARVPEKVISALFGYPTEPAFYYDLRSRAPVDPVQAAARFIYLNRYSFNGIYRVNRSGQFNVPRGSRTGLPPTAETLREAAAALARATLIAADFEQVTMTAKRGDIVYLDPPFPADRPTYGEYGYDDQFKPHDVARLSSALSSIDRAGAAFVLSYRLGVRELDELDWYRRVIQVRRSVAAKATARVVTSEVLLSNRSLT